MRRAALIALCLAAVACTEEFDPFPLPPAITPTCPPPEGAPDGAPDGDGDGLPDGCDLCPNTPSADNVDADLDGVGNVCDPDLDGDGTRAHIHLASQRPGGVATGSRYARSPCPRPPPRRRTRGPSRPGPRQRTGAAPSVRLRSARRAGARSARTRHRAAPGSRRT